MSPARIFLSHATENDPFVRELRLKLERRGYGVAEDSSFRAGDNLPESVRRAIEGADHVVAVVSEASVRSSWVKRELRFARSIALERPGFRVIPLLLPGVSVAALRAIFELPEPDAQAELQDWPDELIAISVGSGAAALDALMPRLIDAIEGRFGLGPASSNAAHAVTELADLILRLSNPRFELVRNEAGKEVRRPVAEARLAFYAPNAVAAAAESPVFTLAAPLGKIEADDLSYYLERYHITPFGVFAERAQGIEKRLPAWGESLWHALDPARSEHAAVLEPWRKLAVRAQRRFTIEMEPLAKPSLQASDAEIAEYRARSEAATELLALPWELLHDRIGYLFHDGLGVRVRRSLPGDGVRAELPDAMRKLPLRVLIVCARPEGEGVDYIDHRVSVRPLVEALNALGDLATYDLLAPATFPALREKLREALVRGQPYHIVHFDGHGVYDKVHGLGGLVFEHPEDAREGKLHGRRHEVITADRLGAELRHAGVGLFFLEACQSARADQQPEASVAAKLLQSGIASVAAMSHSVLVETAKRFTEVFYPALVRGERVGAAMLEGQRRLYDERHRGWGWQPRADAAGKVERRPLELQDWFVPVLYQDGEDPVLLTESPPAERVRREIAREAALALGKLPAAPEHAFVGRSRELLAAERLFVERKANHVLLRGEGGEGKTTLAVELARWLVATRRMDQAAFASVENLAEPRALLWAWGEQIVAQFAAQAGDSLESAEALVVRTLSERDTVLVLDNVESILPPPEGSEAAAARVFERAIMEGVFALCRRLIEAAPSTRIVFTSREALPAESGFDRPTLEIGRLALREGMELVARVLARGRGVNAEALQAQRDEEIEALVRTVNGHARSLVLLAPELAQRGLAATTEELGEIMAELERRYPGERERSLFASVELSLRRLPKDVRAKLPPLGVFQGGGNVQAVAMVLGLDREKDEHAELAKHLHGVGLVELLPPERLPYLRFDPALGPALRRELRVADDALDRWRKAYASVAVFLAQQRFENVELAAKLTLLELPNLLGVLRSYAADLNSTGLPERVVELAARIESLLQYSLRRDAMAEASMIRARARERLPRESLTVTSVQAAINEIERLSEAGRMGDALAKARSLALAMEDTPGASTSDLYRRALVRAVLGRALKKANDPRAALGSLELARLAFESLAATNDEENNKEAAGMASRCITDEGDCLRDLGRLDDAAAKYQDAIERAEKLRDRRHVAVVRFQLGTVRLEQKRYREALGLYHESMESLQSFGESIAVAWHQIGIVYVGMGELDQAEAAYQRSLALQVMNSDKIGEASSRTQLGSLYHTMGNRDEEAVLFHRQAAEIYAAPAIADAHREGICRSNAAVCLVRLGRLADARNEITRAIECKRRVGVSARPWRTWAILCDLEVAAGNTAAAAAARHEAMVEYEKVRRQGWQLTLGSGASLCEGVAQIVIGSRRSVSSEQASGEMRSKLPEVESVLRKRLEHVDGTPEYFQALAPKLLKILDGSRDPALADDPALDYDDAVELKLLLEQLSS